MRWSPNQSSPAYRAYWDAKAEGDELGMQRAMMAHKIEEIRSGRRVFAIAVVMALLAWAALTLILLTWP